MQQRVLVAGRWDDTHKQRLGSPSLLCICVRVCVCSFETVRLLTSLGADMTLVDNDGNSALHHASSNLNFVATRVLIDAGSPLNVVNKDVRYRDKR